MLGVIYEEEPEFADRVEQAAANSEEKHCLLYVICRLIQVEYGSALPSKDVDEIMEFVKTRRDDDNCGKKFKPLLKLTSTTGNHPKTGESVTVELIDWAAFGPFSLTAGKWRRVRPWRGNALGSYHPPPVWQSHRCASVLPARHRHQVHIEARVFGTKCLVVLAWPRGEPLEVVVVDNRPNQPPTSEGTGRQEEEGRDDQSRGIRCEGEGGYGQQPRLCSITAATLGRL